MTQSTTFSWREIVEKTEGEKYWLETLYPTVYVFTGRRTFRDSGPESGIYEKTP